MSTIGTPIKIPELNLQPEPTGGIELSENMQQVLSLNTAFWRNKRVVLKASPSGILFTCSPQLEDVFHLTGVGANDTYQGSNIKCSEVMVMGHPDNTDNIWVRSMKAATVNNAWPLAAKEVMGFSITNLNMLHLLIVTAGEKAIIAYTL